MTQTDEKVAAKYCKNCKWCFPDRDRVAELYECRSPKNPHHINLVSGDKEYVTIYCAAHRNSDGSNKGYCTPAGNWYEETELQLDSSAALDNFLKGSYVEKPVLCKTGTEIVYSSGGGGDGDESLTHLIKVERMVFGRN